MQKIVFVTLSHKLTQEQIEDLNADKIILLSDVNADLAARCRQIDPNWGIKQVQLVAASVVAEAVKVGATHFCLQGEYALFFWANLYASGKAQMWSYLNNGTISSYLSFDEYNSVDVVAEDYKDLSVFDRNKMTCLQTTTKRKVISETYKDNGEVTKIPVFKHIQWRELF